MSDSNESSLWLMWDRGSEEAGRKPGAYQEAQCIGPGETGWLLGYRRKKEWGWQKRVWKKGEQESECHMCFQIRTSQAPC